MIARINSGAVAGIDGYIVEVEVTVAPGLPGISIVGLPDAAVKESADRVESAIRSAGLDLRPRRVTVNLAPADVKKEGSAFDLPIALGILAANDLLKSDQLDRFLILGELSLDGRVKPVRGVLSIAVEARAKKFAGILAPPENCSEAAVIGGIAVHPVSTLPEALEFLNGKLDIAPHSADHTPAPFAAIPAELDFADVKGQHHVKRSLEIAAAGGHNILLVGPPGSGKSMLAKRLPTILPQLTRDEAIETTQVHSIMGLLPGGAGLVGDRPFRAPHHTISDAGLIGGGRYPLPGEVSLAHNGVLFLDELPEFRRNVLEVLRQPLEDGKVNIARAAGSITYPAGIMLAAAMNPCPCGYKGDSRRDCSCTPLQVKKYVARISGPLMDRIDLHIEVPALEYQELSKDKAGESSLSIRERVEKARAIQQNRFRDSRAHANARMGVRLLRQHCKLDEASKQIMAAAMDKLGLSARAHDSILKVARTIADLVDAANIRAEHVAEAIQYRSLDRGNFG